MCLSKAFIDRKDKKELLMEEIATVFVEDGKLTLTSLFGEQKEITASIKMIDFATSSILLEEPKKIPQD
jgi:predicted RNA-binding protein